MENNPSDNLLNLVTERYKNAPDRIATLFSNGIFERVLNAMTQQYQLTEQQKKLLDNEMTLVMLLFLPRTGMTDRLIDSLEIDNKTAEKIATDVNDKLFGLVNDILSSAEVELFENDPGEPVSEKQEGGQVKSIKDQSQVQPIRTMEGDLKRVHGYGSFGELYGSGETEDDVYRSDQDSVVKKQNLADTPTYNEPKAES